MKFLIVAILISSNLWASSTEEIGRAMTGHYELLSGNEDCVQELTMDYLDDGNPYYCAHNEGPRLELRNSNGEKFGSLSCLDEPKHGSMIDYLCNNVWDAKTSKEKGAYNVQIRTGVKCVMRLLKWNNSTTYSLKDNTLTIKLKIKSTVTNVCRYNKVN